MSGFMGGGQPNASPGMMPPPSPAQAGVGGPTGGTGPVGVPPGAQPNPAFQQWMQQYQKQQAIVAENAKRQAQFDAACKLIKDDGIKGFKLDIEADSTIAPDEQAEQQARVAFLQQIVPLIQQITPIAQGNPEMATLASEIAMFVIRGFRVARPLEEAFEKAFNVLGTMPPVPPKGAHAGAQTDPALEQAKIAAQVHDTQTRAQTEQAKIAAQGQMAQMNAASDQQAAAAKAQTDQLAIAQKAQQAFMQLQAARERAAQEDENNQARMALEAEKVRSSERINQARMAKMAARSAEGLT